MSLSVGNVIIQKATEKAMQLGHKYGDFFKCEQYNKLLLRVVHCYFLWRAGEGG